jgi:peptidoglycan/LPS O-acetylase OafA/YrhL
VKAKEEVYFGQLDGVRFIAVSLVLIDHWLAERNVIPLGPLGVTMFFVLSGFLITRILIQSKFKDETTGRSHWFSVKQFMIRRSLRIFPIYYLTIFACFVLNEPPVREKIVWCLLYATNFYIAFKETWLGSIDHLWSLGVEEQYYLIFPYLILFLPKRYFLNIFWAMVLISIGLRFVLYLNGNPWSTQYVLMPTNLDSFGLGGLLAYLFTFHKENIFLKLNQNAFLNSIYDKLLNNRKEAGNAKSFILTILSVVNKNLYLILSLVLYILFLPDTTCSGRFWWYNASLSDKFSSGLSRENQLRFVSLSQFYLQLLPYSANAYHAESFT